jgi:hypothetical protein
MVGLKRLTCRVSPYRSRQSQFLDVPDAAAKVSGTRQGKVEMEEHAAVPVFLVEFDVAVSSDLNSSARALKGFIAVIVQGKSILGSDL